MIKVSENRNLDPCRCQKVSAKRAAARERQDSPWEAMQKLGAYRYFVRWSTYCEVDCLQEVGPLLFKEAQDKIVSLLVKF